MLPVMEEKEKDGENCALAPKYVCPGVTHNHFCFHNARVITLLHLAVRKQEIVISFMQEN